MSAAGESRGDGRDGHRVEFVYTGQARSEIPRDVTRLRVDPSVKRILGGSFQDCEHLEEVELCEGLEEIGGYAFRRCTCLKFVRIPPNVKRIGGGAFWHCKQLEEAELCEGLEEIGGYAFIQCESLKLVKIPSTVKKIDEQAFEECEQLEKVELCEGLQEIDRYAFERCKSLKWVRIPSTVRMIGKDAFLRCEQLEGVELCEGLQDIGDCAFRQCECLKQVRIPPSVKRLGEGAFQDCEQLEQAELCEELEEIGEDAFGGCKSLKHARIPPTITRIGEGTFEGCEQLEEVELCEGIEEIGGYAFSGCQCLKRVRIPPTVKKIGTGAFCNCDQTEVVELCRGLEEIGDCAFENCFSLRNISIPSSLKLMGAHALRGCHDVRKLFGSQNMILNALKCRLEGLPVHQLCYYQSSQPAHLTFEQLQNILGSMSDQVEASIQAESSPTQKKGNRKRAATWSGSNQKLRARYHGAGESDVASGTAIASGGSYFPINISNEIGRNQDCLGMTPLHILACSTKQNLGLYELIFANQPKCLITKDKWGCLPIFYAICRSCLPEIVQFLIDSHKSVFPDIDLNWDMMVSTLCRAAAPLDLVQLILEIKQVCFPEQSISFLRTARELTIHCLIGCDSFSGDFPSRWEFVVEVFSDYRAQQGFLESLLEIQQTFFPDHSAARWQAVCEEFTNPLKGWWKPEPTTTCSCSIFQFLVRCHIPERLHAIGVRKWQKDIGYLVGRSKSLPVEHILDSTYMDTIQSKLVFYECAYSQLKEKTSLIELVLWKSKIGESLAQHNNTGASNRPDELSANTKTQYRIRCGAEIIIPNVLPYLIADGEKGDASGADGDMDESSSSEEDTFEDGSDGNGMSSSSSDDSDDEDMGESSSTEKVTFEDHSDEDGYSSSSIDDSDDEA